MDQIHSLNPYPSFRAGQRESVQDLIQAALDGSQIIEYKGPTGCGKSLVLTVVARALTKKGFAKTIYTTPQKTLVAQLANDEHLRITTLIGRANYPCPKVKSNSAADCPVPSKIRRKTCPRCPYILAKDAFLGASLGVTTLDKILVDKSIPTPNILIIDESQSLETKLIEQRAIELPGHVDLKNLEESVGDWVQIVEMEKLKYETKLEKAFARMVNVEDDELNSIMGFVDEISVVKIAKTLTKIERILAKAENVYQIIINRPGSFVIDKNRNFKLINGRTQFEEMIRGISLVILASGTPCTQLLATNYEVVCAPHPIDVERRHVYYDPCGKMNLADRGKTIDRIAEKIVELHQKYNRNTLVHCHSYHIADRLGQAVCDLGIRCKWVEKNEREENIQTWKEMNDVCLMSVACEEGLDLPGEKYPLNIIAKVPFGYRGDEWFMKRIEADASLPAEQKWENVAVAVAIQQAAGRCTRGPDDFSETYILDGSFEWFYKRNYALFEGWFKDALRRKTREA